MEESYEEEHQSPRGADLYLEEVKEGFQGPGFGEGIEIMLLNILHQSSLEHTTVASSTFCWETKSFCDSYQQLQERSYVTTGEKVLIL